MNGARRLCKGKIQDKNQQQTAAAREGCMAQRPKKISEIISLQWEAGKVVSYADYFSHRPLFSSLQVKNAGEETINDLTLTIYNASGLLVNCTKVLEEIPYESVVEVDLGNVLSPLYFTDLTEVQEDRHTHRAAQGIASLCRAL